MKLALGLAGVLCLVACSSDAEGPPQPTSCRKTDRAGTYLFSYVVQSGDCPAIPDTLVTLGPSANPSTTCTTHAETWSEGDCKLANDSTCETTTADGTKVTNRATLVSYQRTDNGSRIEGTYSVRIAVEGGNQCMGTYQITAVRQ